MKCPNCGTALPDTAKFCFECGQPLTAARAAAPPAFASPAAYTPRHLADKILTSRAAMEGERKQVTVLFCDLVNSTGLAERLGAERMHALLNGFFELALAEIHRLEGTINQFLGDGFMALFGAPIAHEDDARRAALAAVAVRRAVKDRGTYMGLGPGDELAVRIGINTGLVVVGSIGDNLRMDYTAVGDTTNVAARLQQRAEPGDILIAASTARLIRGDFRLVAAGALEVKGKREPVTAYKVLGPAPRRSVLDRAGERAFGRFVGRASELRALNDALAGVLAGEGRIVSVIGEAGYGKSRLLYEFRRSLGDLAVDVLEGRCRSYGRAIPYLPVLDVLRAQCGLLDTDTAEQTAEKVRATLEALEIDAVARAPYVLGLLGVKEGAEPLETLSPEAVRAGTVETLRLMLLAAVRKRPLIVVIEDLHWIDPQSEALITGLMPALENEPLLLIDTFRPDYRPPWHVAAERGIEIRLGPLTDEESITIVQSVIQREHMSDATLRTILDRAEGNPLFLEELTRAVTEQRGDSAVEVPDTLRGVLTARIDRLRDEDKRALQTAAVLGREFPQALFEAVWDGPGSAAERLTRLATLEFLHERLDAPEPTYAFNHALTQDVVYDTLLSGQRAAVHEAAARALEKHYAGRLEAVYDRLAHHWGNTHRAECAIYYLERVAERASRAYANAEAARALEAAEGHARRLPDGECRRLALVLRRAQAIFLLGKFRESLELLLRESAAFEESGQPALLAGQLLRIGSAYGLIGDATRAKAAVERAIAIAASAGERGIEGQALQLLARERMWTGDFPGAVEAGERAVERLGGSEQRFWLALAHWILALTHGLLGAFARAEAEAAACLAIGERIGDPRIQSQALWTAGWLSAVRGDWEAGIDAGRRAVELAPDAVSIALAKGFLANAYLEKSDGAAAEPLLDTAVAAFREFHFPQLEGWFLTFLGQARLLRGDLEGARESVERGVRLTGESGFVPAVAAAEIVLGRIARVRGDLAAARAHFARAATTMASRGSRFEAARARLALAETAAAAGDRAAARSAAREAREMFVELGVPFWADRAAALAG